MPEKCTVYSTRIRPFSIEELEGWASGALVTSTTTPDDSHAITVQWPDCTLMINTMPADGLTEHLNEFRDYIWSCGQEMTEPMYDLIQRTFLIHHCFGIVSDPLINNRAEQFLSNMTAAGNGLLFRENCIFDSAFNQLVGPEGVSETHSVPYWPDALERKQRTSELLDSRDLQVPETLPPVSAELETLLRTPEEVGRRVWALYAVAYRAVPNGMSRKSTWALLKGNEGALTSAESAFLKSLLPGIIAKTQFAWRFEALWVLLWALGYVQKIKFPAEPTEVSEVESIIDPLGAERLAQCKSLRPIDEILDHLDLIYRCHWITRNTDLQEKPIPSSLDWGVVLERHYALNWLTCRENADWDDVSTDT